MRQCCPIGVAQLLRPLVHPRARFLVLFLGWADEKQPHALDASLNLRLLGRNVDRLLPGRFLGAKPHKATYPLRGEFAKDGEVDATEVNGVG